MASPSSWSAALRHTTSQNLRRRPLSALHLSAPHFAQSSSLPSSPSSSSTYTAVRWASIVPYSVNEHSFFSPPPPPMTLEQVQQHVHRKQQSLLEEQVQQEQQQRMRQQRELQLELAKHRNAILARQTKEDEQQQKQHQQTAQRRDQDLNRVDNAAAEPVKATAATTVESSAKVEVQDREPSRPFVATRYRSVFGYRGPEQSGQNAVETELQEPVATITMGSRRVLFKITAENRVRLALLDYTPKQIDAMTPAQALAILSPGSQKQQEARLDCQESTPELSQDEQQQQQRNHDADDHGLEMDIISAAQETGGCASMHVVADVISSPDSHGHNYSHGHGGLVSSPSSTSPTPKAASSRRSTDNSSSSSSSSPSTF